MSKMNEPIKTKFQLRKEARELEIYNEWNELMSQPGAMAVAVNEYMMSKYDIYGAATIFFIRKRVEKRIKAEGKI